jgi:hypothetical protein
MFKKGKAGSGFKAGAVNAVDTERRALLAQLGYQFDSVTKKFGWFWTKRRVIWSTGTALRETPPLHLS